MRKKSNDHTISAFAFVLLFTGLGIIAYDYLPQISLTGLAIYDPVLINLSFVAPTPDS